MADETKSFGVENDPMAVRLPSRSEEADSCISCEAMDTYSDLAGSYVASMSEALAGPMQTLFVALLGLWAAVTGLKIMLGEQSPTVVFKDVFFIILAFGLMKSQGTELIANIYNLSLTLMGDVATVAFSLDKQAPPVKGEGFSALMRAGESGVRGVINYGLEYFSKGSWNKLSTWILPILLILPYFMVVVVFFSKVVVAIFRLMMIGTFAPFLIMAFAYSWGRPMAISGLKTLLSTIAILFAASAAFGLLLYGVDRVFSVESIDLKTPAFQQSDFLVVIVLGWMGVALMTEGVGLANSITGTALSNTAAGILTAGIAGSAAMMARYGRGAATAGSAYNRMRQGTSDNIGGFMQMGRDAKAVMSRAAGVARPFVPRSGNP